MKEVNGKLGALTRGGGNAEATNSAGQAPFQGQDEWVMVEKDSRTTAIGKGGQEVRPVAGPSRETHARKDSKKENVYPVTNKYKSGPEGRTGNRQSY